MSSVLDLCTPREELLSGTFNPEIFTASLDPIIKYSTFAPRKSFVKPLCA